MSMQMAFPQTDDTLTTMVVGDINSANWVRGQDASVPNQ